MAVQSGSQYTREGGFDIGLACSTGDTKPVIEYFNKTAASYDEYCLTTGKEIGAISYSKVIEKHRPDKDIRILDAAAGTGILGQQLENLGYTCVDAMDPSIGMLNQARSKGIYSDYICDMIQVGEKTQVPDDTYDVICVLGGVTYGCISPDSFPELVRITKKCGLFTFCMPDHLLNTQTDVPKLRQDKIEANLQALVADTLCSKWTKESVTYYSSSCEHGEEKGDVYIVVVA